MEPIQEIKAEHGANTAVILTNWMDTQDQIRSKGLEPGPYADRLEPEQRLSALQDQALEKAKVAHERTRRDYLAEVDRFEERVHARRQELRAKNFFVESTEAVAAALGADDAALLDMRQTSELTGNEELGKAAFVAAHRRGLGDVIAAYFERVNPEGHDAYQEWLDLPDPEAIETKRRAAEQAVQMPTIDRLTAGATVS
jgi:hypothetical protein